MSSHPKMECCCGVSVHSGAQIAAWISIVCSVIMGVLRFPLGLVATFINIAICGMMLYGIDRKRSGFYLPYLILSIVSIIFQFIALIIQFGDPSNRHIIQEHGPIVIILSIIIFLAIMAPISYLFIVVPYRSYQLTKYETESIEHPPLNPTPNAPLSHYP